jgi:hypothetical protein
MGELFGFIWCAVAGLFRSRAALQADILVLRHQLNILRRRSPKSVALGKIDRLVFCGLYRLSPTVLHALKILQPETVIRWHRAGFRAYCCWRSRRQRPAKDPRGHSPPSKRRANLLYAKVPHATIKARTIAAIPVVNQKSRCRPVPRFAGLPNPLLDAASLGRGGFLCWRAEPQRKREAFGTGSFGRRKNRKPKCPARGALGTLANRSLGPDYAGHAYTSPRFWRKS